MPDARRRAAGLGLAWGLGHASSLLVLGLPFVFVAALLPPAVEVVAKTLIGAVIMLLAVRLPLRWREGAFHAHAHRYGQIAHRHLHPHPHREAHHDHAHEVRSPLIAYGIGVVHGIGGSAGITLLLLAGTHERGEAVAALVLFALATAASMAILSAVFGLALGLDRIRGRFLRWSPAFAALAFTFGFGYSAAGLRAVL